MAVTKVTYDTGSGQSTAQFQSQCDLSMGGLDAMNSFIDFNGGLVGGNATAGASVVFEVGMAKATGTLTLTSVVATNTFAVNGVTFTAVASGATGNQFNVGVSDTLTAANAAAAVNASASALVSGNAGVLATSALGVVTLTAKTSGVTGNAITLTGGTNIAASGARLTGGSDGTVTTVDLS
jgi:hypothetical protein